MIKNIKKSPFFILKNIAEMTNAKSAHKKENIPICFVIMPISDPEGYEKGHFRKVFEDVISVACEKAGYEPLRADDVKETNLIHLDILKKLIESPMAICDLSTRNPNVLFELGLRQAFDKPTVLIQENGTPEIFDISPLRYTEYRKALKYRDVIEDQERIAKSIIATKKGLDSGNSINSIVKLLSLGKPASLNEVNEIDTKEMLRIVMSEIDDLKSNIRDKNIYTKNSISNDFTWKNLIADYNDIFEVIDRDGFKSIFNNISKLKELREKFSRFASMYPIRNNDADMIIRDIDHLVNKINVYPEIEKVIVSSDERAKKKRNT